MSEENISQEFRLKKLEIIYFKKNLKKIFKMN